MKNMDKILLIGGGGHCKVVIDAIRKGGKYEIYGIVDANIPEGDMVMGVPVIGNDSDLGRLFEDVKKAFITVGSIGDCSLRMELYKKAKETGFDLPVIIHPAAVIASDVEEGVGEGTFIAASATINPGTSIGMNVIVNTSASIDHDCVIGDFVHIAPGAVLSGNVKVADAIHIGTGAKIAHGACLDKNNPDHRKIKAGSLVYETGGRTYVNWPYGVMKSGDPNDVA